MALITPTPNGGSWFEADLNDLTTDTQPLGGSWFEADLKGAGLLGQPPGGSWFVADYVELRRGRRGLGLVR